jgi:N-acetylglucosamine repressor
VTVSEGIGVGMLLNGQLFHGTDELAGEFGHVTLDESGPPCSCGKSGCWEQYASNSAALAHYLADAPGGRDGDSTLTFDDILRRADRGDARAIETLERMARYLGIGLAPIVTGLAPQVLVMIGPITAAWSRVGPILEEVVRSRSMSLIRTRIVPTDPATQPRLRGAVTLVVQRHFAVPNVA